MSAKPRPQRACRRAPVGDLDAWEREQAYPLIAGGELAHESPSWRRAAEAGQLQLLPDSKVRDHQAA